jgi:hypothetical protein
MLFLGLIKILLKIVIMILDFLLIMFYSLTEKWILEKTNMAILFYIIQMEKLPKLQNEV